MNSTPQLQILLPAVPPLDRALIRAEAVTTAGGGVLEALVPVQPQYRCYDPFAPILLLIPGMGLDGTGLIRQLQLGELAHVYLFQMPNHPAPGETGLAQFARHVEEYILRKRLDQHPGGLILGGNSMGGAISLLVASRGRVKLRGLALVGTFGHAKHLPAYQRAAAPLAWVLPMNFGHVLVCRTFGLLRRSRNEDWKWIAHPGIWRTNGFYGRAVKALTTLDLLDGARNLKVPTIVIHGQRDRVLPHAAAVELSQTIPGARLVTIESAGHNLFFSHADAVNTALAQFVGNLESVRPLAEVLDE